MGTFSNNLQSVANRLLTAYGETVTFTRVSSSEYNTVTGGVEPMSSTTFTAVAHPSKYRLDEIDGEVIEVSDIKLIVYTTTEPVIGDQVDLDNVTYRVMNVEKVKAQGEVIMYRLQIRK